MTYEKTLEKIHSYYAFGKKPGLERITELMRILGDPQDSLSIIHVAGTNGKGSTCAYLYNVLEQAGYACGLYTSPYIEKFTERIQFHGEQISEEDLIRIGARVFSAAEEIQKNGFEEPTEFDIITAIAFVYYAEVKADFVILEVGLGGRCDATNVIKAPLATVITSISLDHTAVLGNTPEAIAREKAGIVKPGVPLIFFVKDPEARLPILEAAMKQSPAAPVYDVPDLIRGGRINLDSVEEKLGGYCFSAAILGYQFKNMELSMTGYHQVENAMCALTTLEVLRRNGTFANRNIPEGDMPCAMWKDAVSRGLKLAVQPGRFEIISEEPLVILDGAHNQDGIRTLQESLSKHFTGKRLLCVLGVLKDKAVGDILTELKPLTNLMQLSFVTTEPDNPRKMGAEALADAVKEALGSADCRSVDHWEEALALVKAEAQEYDAVIVFGSLYLIGSIREGWKRDHEDCTACVQSQGGNRKH
ncbi:MAG: bifunctional folylpolyglutamate synthase/dihydrofolate synthase [Firmicutes bacterium]|nr:bifunctional folylpolyglutamate synthase/dihydrofolate synthase [Bacillota bacterium]